MMCQFAVQKTAISHIFEELPEEVIIEGSGYRLCGSRFISLSAVSVTKGLLSA